MLLGLHATAAGGAPSADSREAKEKSEERRVSSPVQSQRDLYSALRALQSPWRARLAVVRVLKGSRELGLQALLPRVGPLDRRITQRDNEIDT